MSHKITNIQPGDQWTGSDGNLNFDVHVTLDNGRTAKVTAKTPDRWKVGDEVEIKSERANRYGTKWSLDKAGYGQGAAPDRPKAEHGTPSRPGKETREIQAAWAIQTAIAWHGTSKALTIEVLKGKAKELLALKAIIAGELDTTAQPAQPAPETQPAQTAQTTIDEEPPY